MTAGLVAGAELRRDPISGRVVVVAPERSHRPGAFQHTPLEVTPEELADCPFCAGHEACTPPETLRLPAGADEWHVRVVPNLYPAFAGQEVVIHTSRHCHFLADLTDDEIALVAEAWQLRSGARGGYLHAFVNERPEAGASIPHTHSQLVWLDAPPPEVGREQTTWKLGRDELTIEERDGVAVRAAWAGRMPYELLIMPLDHAVDPWDDDRLATALQLAAEGLRRLHRIEGPCPANLWLHAAGHWHLEVLPRLTVLGGIELGAGYFVNPLSPEAAAEALRSGRIAS
jgi:UDPglucose--hexose-1-phosphate uridylyltransferase